MKHLLIIYITFGCLLLLYGEKSSTTSQVPVTPRTLAVMDLMALNEIPHSLAELVTGFVFDAACHVGEGTYKIVARDMRDELLKEIEFSQSELSNTALYLLQVGKHLSVQYLLTGNISSWEGRTYLLLQLTDVATSEVIGSEVSELNHEELKQAEIYTAVQAVFAQKKRTPEQSPLVNPFPQTVVPGQEHQDKLVAMVPVAGGIFLMGSEKGKTNEKPVHEVKLGSFYMSRYEIDHALYLLFCQATNRNYYSPAKVSKDNFPIRYVSWYDACAFCNWLSLAEGLTPCYKMTGKSVSCNFEASGYRLPTEAEWEYAATGGQKTRLLPVENAAQALTSIGLTTFAGSDTAADVAWYQANAKNSVQPVGSKKPNALGLYDMSGNVWEWCWDRYVATYYSESEQLGPTGPVSGNYRSLRGGAWDSSPAMLRTTARGFSAADDKFLYIGFRIIRSALPVIKNAP